MAGTEWQAVKLQVALFTQQALSLNADIFTAFAGQPPDRQEDRLKEGVRLQVGALGDAELRAIISPIRVDLVLTPPPLTPEVLVSDSSLYVGELKSESAKFHRRVLAWLPKWETATTRISLVIQARAPAPSAEGAYEILRDNLSSVRVMPGEMRDLLFRVNWRAKTDAIPEGYYNRLSTWNALNLKAVAANKDGSGQVEIRDLDFAQLEIDLNTPAERSEPLARDKMSSIYDEFFQLAAKIAGSGEGP